MSGLIDLSHVVSDGMVTYPGLPSPVISDHLSRTASHTRYAAGTEFQIGKIEMIANTGTYVDAPSHRYADGADLADLPLDRLADLDGVVIRRVGMGRVVDRDAFAGIPVEDRAVLIHTGWDRHWGTPAYGSGNPYVTSDAAEYLVHQGAVLVGIDSLNIDDPADGTRPAHTILLGARVTIVEHLTGLERLPDSGFRFFAVPVKVRGMGSFPVRAFARIE
ncbi:MAG TPA: cyclase family protein [Gemmatimonadales bacterium]|nr:cyclase family protein [Gemmatimonadales bacterium]